MCNNLWKRITNHESTIKRTEQTSFVEKITEKVSDIRFMCNINYMIKNLATPSYRWFSWRPRNQKSDPLCLLLFDLNHTNICSMGIDLLIQKFFFFWIDLPPSNRFDFLWLWSCRFYCTAYHHWKEGKKYQHLLISSYMDTHFQHLYNCSICLSQPMTKILFQFVMLSFNLNEFATRSLESLL